MGQSVISVGKWWSLVGSAPLHPANLDWILWTRHQNLAVNKQASRHTLIKAVSYVHEGTMGIGDRDLLEKLIVASWLSRLVCV